MSNPPVSSIFLGMREGVPYTGSLMFCPGRGLASGKLSFTREGSEYSFSRASDEQMRDSGAAAGACACDSDCADCADCDEDCCLAMFSINALWSTGQALAVSLLLFISKGKKSNRVYQNLFGSYDKNLWAKNYIQTR